MTKKCLNCGDKLVVKVNVNTPSAIFCNKAECQKAREKRAQLKKREYQRKYRKTPDHYCKHCGVLLTMDNSNQNAHYCKNPECQAVRKKKDAEVQKKWRLEHKDRKYKRRPYQSAYKPGRETAGGWTYAKMGVCCTCGDYTKLNRVSQCKRCRNKVLSTTQCDGDWMFASMDD